MKIFITVLVLIFSLQSWTKADDIREFEIEGISVGDSLLEHYSKTEIDNKKSFPQWKSKKFSRFVSFEDLKQYDGILFYFQDDGKYLISSISAVKKFPDNIDECLKQQKKIVEEFKIIFRNYEINAYESDHQADETGDSKNNIVDFSFNNGTASRIICTEWSDKMNITDELRITLQSKEYTYFITHEAWN